MFDADSVALVSILTGCVGLWVGRGMGKVQGAQAERERLFHVVERSIEEADERAKEVMGARMTLHQVQQDTAKLQRLAGFWRAPDEAPPEGATVIVLRDAGVVGNGLHPGHRTGRWLELTTAHRALFACDALSTGTVIGWAPADEFLALKDLHQEREGMVLVPADPSPGLLMSMAIRYDHGLGCPGYYDASFFAQTNGFTHQQRLESVLREMRKLHEEVVGSGFYSPEKDASYAALAKWASHE